MSEIDQLFAKCDLLRVELEENLNRFLDPETTAKIMRHKWSTFGALNDYVQEFRELQTTYGNV